MDHVAPHEQHCYADLRLVKQVDWILPSRGCPMGEALLRSCRR